MEFYDVVGHVLELLQRQKRVSYRALKLQFRIDDDYIEDVKEELLYAHQSSVQTDDRGLIWTGDKVSDETPIYEPSSEPRSPKTTEPAREPLSYTPLISPKKF